MSRKGNTQSQLFSENYGGAMVPATNVIDGGTFQQRLDGRRLQTQLAKVARAVADGQWWTLEELAKVCGGSEAGVSARLRDLRKDRNGGHTIERQRVTGGLWRYRRIQSNV